MFKFFRNTRLDALGKNKISRYLKYAIGEIFLVMIGILLALQVNNWNQKRNDRITEKKLLTSLQEDLLININRLENDIALESLTISQALKTVAHLDERKPYNDSLDKVFKEAVYSPDITISSSTYETIKFKGIDIIVGDSLQRGILNLYDVVYANLIAETVRLENQFWPSSVLPMIHKHLRVYENGYKPTNYPLLLEDIAFKNMVMHRTHFRKLAKLLKTEALSNTREILAMIQKRIAELNN